MFFKIRVASDINEEYLITYKIKDGQTLEDIADDIYGDSGLWWIIALVNDNKDVYFDLPLDPNSVQTIANAKAKTVSGKITTGGTTLIIASGLAGVYGDDYFNGSTFQHLTGTNALQEITITDYEGQTGLFTFASASQINANDTYIIEDAPLDIALFSEYYDLLEEYNQARRDIVVLRADYITQFLSDVTKEVADNT